MEIDEWFGTDDTDFNLVVVDGVLTVTRYEVTDGMTNTYTGKKILEIKIETEAWFDVQVWK